jgi:D-alanyl-D-alanine endopeptidase (penicillin-binding protein 7)
MNKVSTLAALGAALLVLAGPALATNPADAPGPASYADETGAAPSTSSKAAAHRVIRHARHQRTGLDQPALRSSAALVLDESTESVLFSKHAEMPTPIASITKLMTALVVLDANQPLGEKLEITADDTSLGKTSVSRLTVGTELTRADLMHLALMSSENRAAHALGRNYPGGLGACVAAMNAKARALGMTATHFVEPTGLSSDNVASPEDLSKLVIAASQNPTIQSYSTDTRYVVPVGRRLLEFRNTDSLVSSPSWNIVVQKTGYIAEAGKCLVMKAIIEGRAVVIVLLDSVGKQTRLADARRIKKWMETHLTSALPPVSPSRA